MSHEDRFDIWAKKDQTRRSWSDEKRSQKKGGNRSKKIARHLQEFTPQSVKRAACVAKEE